jgi:cell wall-associated NlpC family hydrolase
MYALIRRHRSRRMRAYIWAAHQVGEPYCWGGTGGCFDCSGLVMASYAHEGIYFGRDTTEMLASSRLIRVTRRHARKGDLAFYGAGHVELVAGRRYTLGALVPGTLVGWHLRSPWWHPTMYFRVRDAG